jgi:hypothetical protein
LDAREGERARKTPSFDRRFIDQPIYEVSSVCTRRRERAALTARVVTRFVVRDATKCHIRRTSMVINPPTQASISVAYARLMKRLKLKGVGCSSGMPIRLGRRWLERFKSWRNRPRSAQKPAHRQIERSRTKSRNPANVLQDLKIGLAFPNGN